MTKICLLIGEGKSERYFFPRLIQKKGYKDLTLKSAANSLYSKDGVCWFFPFPPGSGKIKNQEGKARLRNHEVYKEAYFLLENIAKGLELTFPLEVHLVICFDTEGGNFEGCKTDIQNALKQANMPFTSVHLQEVHPELEGWYAAGLLSTFPHFFKHKTSAEIEKFLHPDREVGCTKEVFKDHIDHNDLIGVEGVAIAVIEHFDEDKAQEHSNTFKGLKDKLNELGLF